MVMGAQAHVALLTIARDRLVDDALRMGDDDALAVLYLVVLVEEMIRELKDSPLGAAAMERALTRVTGHGLVTFALSHGLVYDPSAGTKLN